MQGNLFDSDPKLIDDSTGKISYFESFLSRNLADEHFRRLKDSTKFRQEKIKYAGKVFDLPRLTCWQSKTGKSYSYSGITSPADAFSDETSAINQLIEEKTGLQFNSVLFNLYRNGNDKVAWHADDERELGDRIHIASLSLGAERDFRLRLKNRNEGSSETITIRLKHGSLLLMEHPTQIHWEHEIPRRANIDQERLNLTFRHFP